MHGLRSVPMIFSTVADGLEFMIRQVGVSDVSHYFKKKKKKSRVCSMALQTTLGCVVTWGTGIYNGAEEVSVLLPGD